jgi:hypothetical protein
MNTTVARELDAFVYAYSLLPLMKLPRDRVLRLRFPPKKLRRFVVVVVVVRSLRPPPMQNRIEQMKKQAAAAHSNPKAYSPMWESWPLSRKLFRPLTYAALQIY